MKESISGLFTRDGQRPLPLLGVRLEGQIVGRMAVLKLTQHFRNEEKTPLEVLYRFPLPEGGALHGFRAVFADRMVEGEIEEREKAFERYDDALAEGNQAILLDRERPNIFTLSLGNLRAAESACLELELALPLEGDAVEARFSLPTSIAPRYLPAGAVEADGQPSADRLHPEYARSVPYGLQLDLLLLGRPDAVSSPSHPVELEFGENGVRIRFASVTAAMDRDFRLNIRSRAGEAGTAFRGDWKGESFVLLEFTPPDLPEAGLPRELVFLLDCSGSMQGSSIDCARRALRLLIKALDPADRFNIIRFGSHVDPFFPAPRRAEEALDLALERLERVTADLGGTELEGPLVAALENPPQDGSVREIILLTDGDVGNEQTLIDRFRPAAGICRLYPVGIGHGPNAYVLAALARVGLGEYLLIAPGESIEPPLLRLFGRLGRPRLDELRIDWGQDAEQTPGRPALLAGRPGRLLGRLPAGEFPRTLNVHYRLGGKLRVLSLQTETIRDGRSLAALWARSRIEELEEGGGSGSRQSHRRAGRLEGRIVELSRRYGVPSSLTSFVGVVRLAAADKVRQEAKLIKIPTLFTHDWHGTAREAVQGRQGLGAVRGLFQNFVPLSMSAAVCPGLPSPPRKKARASYRERLPDCESMPSSELKFCMDVGDALPPSPDAGKPASLYAILDAQKARGGFHRAGLPPEIPLPDAGELDALCQELPPGLSPELAVELRVAALVLAWLEVHYAADRAIWEPLLGKTIRWLQNTAAGYPTAQTLAAWARERIGES